MHGGLGNVGMHVWHVHECVMPAGTYVRYQCSVQIRHAGQQHDAVQCAKACLCMHRNSIYTICTKYRSEAGRSNIRTYVRTMSQIYVRTYIYYIYIYTYIRTGMMML